MTSSYQRRSNGWRSNQLPASARTISRNGCEYLRFPLVPLREMVLDYPEQGTSEYLPANSIRSTAGAWDGTPLVFRHPKNAHRTANDPDAYTGEVIGAFHDPEFVDGEALRGNALVDVAKAEDIGGLASEVVRQLRDGQTLSVSAGYATVEDTRENGSYRGEQYDLVQGTVVPDHIAVFPSDEFTARCRPEDGCAAPRANAANENTETATETMTTNTFENDAERQRALQAISDDLGTPVDRSEFPNDEVLLTVARASGYQNAEEYPGGRESWEARQNMGATNADTDASTDAPGVRTSGDTHRDAVATRESYEQRKAEGDARASPSEYVSTSDRQQARALARRLEATNNRAMAQRVREEYGIE